MLNPCAEISLGNPQPVEPWVQLHWMQALRVYNNLPPYTHEECDDILRTLGSSVTFEEAFGLSKHIHEQRIRSIVRKQS